MVRAALLSSAGPSGVPNGRTRTGVDTPPIQMERLVRGPQGVAKSSRPWSAGWVRLDDQNGPNPAGAAGPPGDSRMVERTALVEPLAGGRVGKVVVSQDRRDQFAAAVHTGLTEHRFQVILDRVGAQVQPVGYVLGRQTLTDEGTDHLLRSVNPNAVMMIG